MHYNKLPRTNKDLFSIDQYEWYLKGLLDNLRWAAYYDDFIKSPYESVDDRTDLHIAVDEGHLEPVKRLVERGMADVNCLTTNTRLTLLHLAVLKGHIEIIKYLANLDSVDVNAGDAFGNTILHYAYMHPNAAVFRTVIDIGRIDEGAKNNFGRNGSEERKYQDHRYATSLVANI